MVSGAAEMHATLVFVVVVFVGGACLEFKNNAYEDVLVVISEYVPEWGRTPSGEPKVLDDLKVSFLGCV